MPGRAFWLARSSSETGSMKYDLTRLTGARLQASPSLIQRHPLGDHAGSLHRKGSHGSKLPDHPTNPAQRENEYARHRGQDHARFGRLVPDWEEWRSQDTCIHDTTHVMYRRQALTLPSAECPAEARVLRLALPRVMPPSRRPV